MAQGQSDTRIKIYAPVPHALLQEEATLVFASLTRRLGLCFERSRVRGVLAPYSEYGHKDSCDSSEPAQDGPKSTKPGSTGELR
jgi:hypothetical protein